MAEQITFLDIVDKTEKEKLTPEIWNCQKTCKNFTNVFPDGDKDFFFDGSPRCCYPEAYAGFGSSGKQWKNKVINNMWHSWCKCYIPKD